MDSTTDPTTKVGDEHLSASQGRVERPDPAGMYFGVLKALGHHELLQQYKMLRGESQGRVLLSNEFGEIFRDAKLRVGVEPDLVVRDLPEVGRFNTDTAEKAVALCEAMISRTEELNCGIHRRLRKRILAGVDVLREPQDAEPAEQVHFVGQFMEGLADLIGSGSAGQVWISDAVYRALPEERRSMYRSEERVRTGSRNDREQVWVRHIVNTSSSARSDSAIMNVDMAHSNRIEKHMRGVLNDATQASAILRKQIDKILREGFTRAGELSHDECFERDTGDGAIFLFPSVADAHAVAVGILQAADQYNRPARDDSNPQGLRCFRVGISYGRLGKDGLSDPNGNKFAEAKRIEEWGPTGEVRITEEAYRKLPPKLQQWYGGMEQIPGKRGEPPTPARRYAVTERALWTETDEDGKEYPPISLPDRAVGPSKPSKLAEPCFIITPLRDDPRIQDVYQKLVVQACEKAGFEPRRATQIAGPRNQAITDSLADAPMVLAYLGPKTAGCGWNPNVILEIGYRLATRLPLVILGDAEPDGTVPDYQATLPFQLVHHNVITVAPDPSQSLPEVIQEILDSRCRKPRSQWDTPLPIIECKFTNFADVVITEANDAAKAVFGEENVRENGSAQKLSESIAARTDPLASEARREELYTVLERLETWHRNRLAGGVKRLVPQPRIPIVFNDSPPNPVTGKPEGFLPVVVRYTLEGVYIHVRLLYLRVSSAMRHDTALGYHVCEL